MKDQWGLAFPGGFNAGSGEDGSRNCFDRVTHPSSFARQKVKQVLGAGFTGPHSRMPKLGGPTRDLADAKAIAAQHRAASWYPALASSIV